LIITILIPKDSLHSCLKLWLQFVAILPRSTSSLPVQLTKAAAGALVPAISNPASSTHQQELTISLSHWTVSKPPDLLHLGILTLFDSTPRALARLEAAILSVWHPINKSNFTIRNNIVSGRMKRHFLPLNPSPLWRKQFLARLSHRN
jgi:hypothetical protein